MNLCKMTPVGLFILAILPFLCFAESYRHSNLNYRPIIGMLAQEPFSVLKEAYPQCNSYIAASYVKIVESAGARVVPIWIGKPKSYYKQIMKKINGVFFPGGEAEFNVSGGYFDAGEIIFKIAREFNDHGIHFPLWGTCLGFEFLPYVDAGRIGLLPKCDSQKVSLPLDFTNDFKSSRLYKDASDDTINILGKENVTVNYHTYCVTQKILHDWGLDYNWMALSLNYDLNGIQFISSMEHRSYPFFGTQFHPERIIYEWVTNRGLVHNMNAIKANSYFAQFFVEEARKNNNDFTTQCDESRSLIYNYKPEYTGSHENIYYEQCYLFP